MFWKRVLRGVMYAALVCLVVFVILALTISALGELALYFCLIGVVVLCSYFPWCRLGEILWILRQKEQHDDEEIS